MASLELPPPAPSAAKEKFIVKAPKEPKSKIAVHKLSDTTARWVKILSYGHTGSGKTWAIIGFLLSGLKVCVICTDVGGEGLTTVKTALRDIGRQDLEDNLYYLELPDYEDVELFLKEPTKIFPDIYDIGLDMMVWDGFTGFQQYQLSEYIGEQEAYRGEDSKPVSDARQSGLWLERTDWGQIRNGTIRMLSRFLYLHNKKDGKVWHKYVTCLESGKVKTDQLTGDLQKAPLIQGAAASMMGPAFDLIVQMNVTEKDGKTEYQYKTSGNQKLLAKSRGIKLEPVEPADMRVIWNKICDQLGIPKKAVANG